MARPPGKQRQLKGSKKVQSTPLRVSPRNKNNSDVQDSPEPTVKKQKLHYNDTTAPVSTKKTKTKTNLPPVENIAVKRRNEDQENIDAGETWSDEESSSSEDDVELTTLNEDKSIMLTTREVHQNKRKYPTLKPAETHTLSHFVRRTLFRRLKFVNDPIMLGLLPEIYDKLEIQDPELQKTKTSDLIKCTKDTLSSRRGYVQMIVMNQLRNKLIDGKMFDITLMDKFRDPAIESEADVEEDVKNAWCIFISDFCKCVSFHWTNYLKNIERKESATFRGMLTASDEALAIWLIKIKYEEVKAAADYIKEHGNDAWKKTKKSRKSGSHDSKWRLEEFIELHKSMKELRSNTKSNDLWESIFFDYHLNDTNTCSSVKEPDSASKKSVNECQLMDDADELEE